MSQPFEHLVDVQTRACAQFADRDLFGSKRDGQWQWITYRDFGRRVDDARAGLAALGVGRGDCVAMIAANRVEWAVCAYAAYGLGGLFTPMYEHQHVQDWRYITADCDAKALVVSSPAIYEQVKQWPGEVGTLERVIVIDGAPSEGKLTLAELEENGRANPVGPADVRPEDTAGLIYTSGTTGKPKGVVLSHGNIASNLNAINSYIPMGRQDVSVSFLPWAHSFGQTCELHMMLSLGASVAFAESIPKLVENIGEVGPTVLYAVPRVFNKIYEGVHKRVRESGGFRQKVFEAAIENAATRKRLDAAGKVSFAVDLKHIAFDRVVFSKVRERLGGRLIYAFSGGAALSPEVAEFIDCLGITVFEGYGLTETSPIATANRPGARKIGSVGLPIPGVSVRIDRSVVPDDDDTDHGEVLISGPNIMQGYHKLPGKTADVMTEADGKAWFRTGDLGRIDEDGFLFITGRVKEQYKLENGKYVVPAPLEESLQLSPLVGQAFVYGDNRPFNVALVVADPDLPSQPSDDELRAEVARCSSGWRGYEKPRKVHVLREPFSIENGMLTPKMSIRRRQVVERYSDRLDELYRVG